MTLEQAAIDFINNQLIWLLGGIVAFFFFMQFRKWNIEKFKLRSEVRKKEIVQQKNIDSADIDAAIKNPEAAIEILMSKRKDYEKSHNQAGIETCDTQIKMLQSLVKIPPMFRPYAAAIGQTALKKVETFVKEL